MNTAKTFQDLEVWKKAHKMVLNIYKTSKLFPKEEAFGITSQIRRASISIPANIAEGFKRKGLNDKARFYNIAQSSLEEVRYYLILAEDLQYMKSDVSLSNIDEIARMLDS
ncbi:MAG: four helix bundle protein [Bacteroidetes bacterium]|nr:four helix bundle protein [Bacteroidota bacterium]